MASEPSPDELCREADRQRIQFLRHEIEVSGTFCDLAETEFRLGEHDTAARSLEDARKGYETALRFLHDPHHAAHIPEKEFQELNQGLASLHKRLEQLGARSQGAR